MKCLTANEICEFKPSFYNKMKVKSMSNINGIDTHVLNCIDIVSPVWNGSILAIDSANCLRTLNVDSISRYQSLRQPEWTFEKIIKHPEIKFGTFCYNFMNMKALVTSSVIIDNGIKPTHYFSVYAEGDDALSNYTSLNLKDIELIKKFRFFRHDNSEIFPQED